MVGTPVRASAAMDGAQVEITMRRDSYEAGLDEIWRIATRHGLNFAVATISEWVTHAVEGALLGAAACLGGARLARRPEIVATAACVGGLVGAAAGSLVEREVARYAAWRNPWSGLWQVAPVGLPNAPERIRFGYG